MYVQDLVHRYLVTRRAETTDAHGKSGRIFDFSNILKGSKCVLMTTNDDYDYRFLCRTLIKVDLARKKKDAPWAFS